MQEVLMTQFSFLYSYDDKIACQMILDKRGLKGYQVIQITLLISVMTVLLFLNLKWSN